MKKYILNFTPNGMIPTKDQTKYVPVSPEEIVGDVLEAKKFGASIIHLHARDKDGSPTWKKSIYKEIIDGIRAADGYSNDSLIICVSTSGRNWPDFERRSECLELTGKSKPDMASLTLSSLNFSASASTNSPEMIQKLAQKMLQNNIKPELEAFDPGMINYARYLQTKGLIKPPFYFNLLFGNIANSQTTFLDQATMLANLPEDSFWSFGGIGINQLKMNISAILNGGGIRVGIEDNIYFDEDRKILASNSKLLERIQNISKLIEREPFSPGEVRKMLNLELS
ncbi:3-keto-5-aminohexanoate cleavage protein [uncultured Draconibacterium sp.]|uniref:3-keto-5-aminohexanoate cleavage protein n=1 Tax=uncultured Draconibacterium sp. TaxID=1573823 RepID=UPI002AA7CF8F|nr:3-keto-5-aminohexanoate cleavage protein [uncultured Draconibacterium sp.]